MSKGRRVDTPTILASIIGIAGIILTILGVAYNHDLMLPATVAYVAVPVLKWIIGPLITKGQEKGREEPPQTTM